MNAKLITRAYYGDIFKKMIKKIILKYKILLLLFCFSTTCLIGQQTVGLFQNEAGASDGYTLFGNNKITYLIDQCGFIVNTWESDFDPGLSAYLLENGNLLRTAKIDGFFEDAGISGQFELFNWQGELIWNVEYKEDNIQAHHDIEPLPNGNFLFIAWEKISEAEAQQNGRKYEGEVWSEKIIEMEMIENQQANIVWEWRLWDHLVQDYDSTKLNFANVSDHPELVDLNYIGEGENTNGDWIHLNAISYNAELDQIAMSARHTSEIWIIDHSTTSAEAKTSFGGNSNRGGTLLYRYGNPQAYQGDTMSGQVFFKQHDVRWIPDGHSLEGHLMVFNNNNTDSTSSIEIWNPPLNSDGLYDLLDGEAFGPMSIAWEYTAPDFYSRILSGAHFLPNGNLFITEGQHGRFFEINPAKEKVWEYINPSSRTGSITNQGEMTFRNDVFRATKYPVDYPGFIGRDLSSGGPVERNPWEIECDTIGSIPPPVDGIEISNLSNRVNGILSFNAAFDNRNFQMLLTDISGKKIIEQQVDIGRNEFLISNLPSGIYLLYFLDDQNIYEVFKILKI